MRAISREAAERPLEHARLHAEVRGGAREDEAVLGARLLRLDQEDLGVLRVVHDRRPHEVAALAGDGLGEVLEAPAAVGEPDLLPADAEHVVAGGDGEVAGERAGEEPVGGGDAAHGDRERLVDRLRVAVAVIAFASEESTIRSLKGFSKP